MLLQFTYLCISISSYSFHIHVCDNAPDLTCITIDVLKIQMNSALKNHRLMRTIFRNYLLFLEFLQKRKSLNIFQLSNKDRQIAFLQYVATCHLEKFGPCKALFVGMYSMALVKLNNPFYCFIALFSDDAQLAARKN